MGIGFNTNTSTFPFIAPFSDNSLTEKVFSWKHCRGKSSEIKENQEKSRKIKESQGKSRKFKQKPQKHRSDSECHDFERLKGLRRFSRTAIKVERS